MVKRYNFVQVSGPSGMVTAHDMDEWPDGEYVKHSDYLILANALAEALDGWEGWIDPKCGRTACKGAEGRIQELRKLI